MNRSILVRLNELRIGYLAIMKSERIINQDGQSLVLGDGIKMALFKIIKQYHPNLKYKSTAEHLDRFIDFFVWRKKKGIVTKLTLNEATVLNKISRWVRNYKDHI